MSLSKIIKVIKRKPTRRDQVLAGDVYGSLEIVANTLSLLHIGAGGEQISIPLQVVNALRKILDTAISRGLSVDYIVSEVSKIIYQHGFGKESFSTIRYGDKIVIPGSSLKGAVRSRLELLFTAVNNEVPSCFRVVEGFAPQPAPKGGQGWRHQRVWSSSLENRGRGCDATSATYWEDIQVCIVCDMFGAPGLRSRIDFGNLEPLNNVRLIRADILIRGRSVSFEFIDKNSSFKGVVLLNGLSLKELGLLSIAMRLLEDKPILIGRFKYVKHRLRIDNNFLSEWFGRLKINGLKLRIPFYAENSIKILDENNIQYRRAGIEFIVDNDLEKLLRLAEEEARREYGKYLGKIDEVEMVEKLYKE